MRPGVLTFLGGGRGCAGALTRPSTRHLLPKNFEKTALRKKEDLFTVKMRGGHDYGNDCTMILEGVRKACRFVIKQSDPSDCEPPMFSENILSPTIIANTRIPSENTTSYLLV